MHKAGNVESKASDLDASFVKVSLHMTMCSCVPQVSLAPNWCQTRPNRPPWLHLLQSPTCALPWEIWPWLSKSWWLPWKFAGSLLVQTLPQEQRFCGVTRQKWAVLGSKSHPCQGGAIPAQGVILGSPWQGAVAAILLNPSCLAKKQVVGVSSSKEREWIRQRRMPQS